MPCFESHIINCKVNAHTHPPNHTHTHTHAPTHTHRIKVLLLLHIYQYAYSCHAHAGIPHRTPALASLRLPSYPHSQQPPSGSLGRKTKPTPSPPLPRPRCTAFVSLVFAQKPQGRSRSPHDKVIHPRQKSFPHGESKNEWVDQKTRN